jgi:hypothetical protein
MNEEEGGQALAQGATSSHSAKDNSSTSIGKKRRREREENDGIHNVQAHGQSADHSGDENDVQVKCRQSGRCTNWAQGGGMCAEHSKEQQSMAARNETTAASGVEVGEDSASDIAGSEESAHSDSRVEGPTAPCQMEGCSNIAEKRGRCQAHIIKKRCKYPGGCRNKGHGSDGLCLMHSNAEKARPRTPPPGYSKQKIVITARQQELQARQYCDEVLSARSKELAAIYAASEADAAASDAASLQPLMETTARKQQQIAEQFCNERLAVRAMSFICSGGSATRPSAPAVAKKRGAQVIKECNIRGCRNLVYGREPLCAAHEAWATGCYPASAPPS